MEKWQNIKRIALELLGAIVGIGIFYTYGGEIGELAGDIAGATGRRLENYYRWLLLFTGLDFIWIVAGIITTWGIFTGVGFIGSIILFILYWTPIVLTLVGIDKATKEKLLKGAKLFPPLFGCIIFWLCVVACVAVLHPEIAASGMFIVLSLLIVGVLWGFGHALNKKSDAPEWIMLVAVLLMVGIYAMKQTAPTLYNVIDGQVVVMWNRAQDKVETPEPLKLVEELRKLKLQKAELEESDVLSKLATLQKEQVAKWDDPNARAEIDEKIWEIENVEIPNLREQKKLLARAYEEPAGEKKWFYAILITLVILIAMFLVLILLRRVAHVESKWATGVVVVATICILGVIFWYNFGLGKTVSAWSWSWGGGGGWSSAVVLKSGELYWLPRQFIKGEVVQVEVLFGSVTQSGVEFIPENYNTIPILGDGYVPLYGGEGGGKFKWKLKST